MSLAEGPQTGPLHGLRVVDVTTEPDALSASTFLADLGADVIVIEPPGGHPARHLGPLKGSVSLLWKVTGRNKRSAVCNLESATAAGWLHDLLDRADVLIGEPAFGMDDSSLPELSARHRHLVVLSTSPFGATGPLRRRGGSGRVAEAFGGQTFASGDPERSPLHAGLPIGAATASLFGALGVVAAVLERDRHGADVGQLIDLAGYETVLRGMEFLPIFFQQIGFRNQRSGLGSSYQVPVATWRTADGRWVTFTGNTNDVVQRLYRAMGRPDLIDDPRFATNDARVANRGIVEATMAAWAASRSRDELEDVCREHHVPVGSVLSMADIFEDANYLERQSIAEVTDSELGLCRLPAVVPRFSRTPGRLDHLGQPEPLGHAAVEELWGPRIPVTSGPDQSHPSSGGPLSGLRVIDMGQILAGPYAATVLADLGADVIKVEKPMQGDDFRRQAPLHHGISLWWKASARNKRSIALDLKDPGDHRVFVDLVANADVITANFVPGTLDRLGLGYEALRAINPGIVLVSVSGYGQEGRYRTRRAFGRNAEAYGGLSYVSGYADSPPMPTGFPVADGLSATLGAFAALCALYARRSDPAGVGQHVDVALYETVFRFLELPALMYDQLGVVAGPSEQGTTVGERICVALSADGRWMSASKWSTADATLSGPAEIRAIRDHVEGRTARTLMAEESPLGFALAPVLCIDELIADPQGQTRSSIVRVADDELGEVALAAVVPRFSRTPGRVAHASPKLDEHHEEIVRQWCREPNDRQRRRWEEPA